MDLFKKISQGVQGFVSPTIPQKTNNSSSSMIPLNTTQNMSYAQTKPITTNMSLSPVKPVVPNITSNTNTGDPAVRAQQIALNTNGAGLKVDGILGPLTMAAIKNNESTVKKTTDGNIISPATGGITTSPVIPDTTATPITPINPLEMGVSSAEKTYQNSLQMTPEEEAAQAELDKLSESFKKGYQGTQDQTIPMEFITGQQQSLENRALNLAEPLQTKLARLEAKRTASVDASKFALERADKALETSKTGGEQFTLGKDQVRYDAFGNVIASGGTTATNNGVYTPGADPTTDAYVTGILANTYKFSDVPDEYKNMVAQATAGKSTQPEVSAYQAERTTRIKNSVDDLLKRVGGKTVGFGSLLSAIPESDARNFQADLDSLIANITYGELTAMREASKTGGALGQVSDKEGQLLGAALGALDTKQSPSNFTKNLNQIKESLARWEEANKKYGGTTGSSSGSGVFAEEW